MKKNKNEFEEFMDKLFEQSAKTQGKTLRKIARGLDLNKIPKEFNVPSEYVVG